MTVTLELSKEDIDALNNAMVVFGREVQGTVLGCESWFRAQMEEKYPDVDYADLDAKLMKQAWAMNRIVKEILEKEEEQNEDLG